MKEIVVPIIWAVYLLSATETKGQKELNLFDQYDSLPWQLAFKDYCTGNWKDHWFLDGKKATVANSKEGMFFAAGPKPFEDAHHAVLWTKEDFSGDIKMQWEYTREDSARQFVTILYLLASGDTSSGFETDLKKWRYQRTIPSMKNYFNNMNLLHISYAAYGGVDVEENAPQYLRARRYRPELAQGLKGTDLGVFEQNIFFQTGVKNHITVIKKEQKLLMKITNKQVSKVYYWDLGSQPDVYFGKVGLRHMYTRSATYKNIRIYTLK